MSEQLSEELIRRIFREEAKRVFQEILGIQSREYVNGVDACKILGCSPVTLWKNRKIGAIKSYKFGNGDRRYKVSELLQLQNTDLIRHKRKVPV